MSSKNLSICRKSSRALLVKSKEDSPETDGSLRLRLGELLICSTISSGSLRVLTMFFLIKLMPLKTFYILIHLFFAVYGWENELDCERTLVLIAGGISRRSKFEMFPGYILVVPTKLLYSYWIRLFLGLYCRLLLIMCKPILIFQSSLHSIF